MGLIDHQEFTKGADLHDLHGRHIPVSIKPPTSTVVVGIEDEIEIDGISGADFEEDEDDSMIIDGCVVVGLTESEI